MSTKANPYVGKLVDIMLDIDNGISILSKNFKDYGAASPYFINGDELLVSIIPTDDMTYLNLTGCFGAKR